MSVVSDQAHSAATYAERKEEWIEAITLALTWVPLSHYDEVAKRAERAMSEMLDEIERRLPLDAKEGFDLGIG